MRNFKLNPSFFIRAFRIILLLGLAISTILGTSYVIFKTAIFTYNNPIIWGSFVFGMIFAVISFYLIFSDDGTDKLYSRVKNDSENYKGESKVIFLSGFNSEKIYIKKKGSTKEYFKRLFYSMSSSVLLSASFFFLTQGEYIPQLGEYLGSNLILIITLPWFFVTFLSIAQLSELPYFEAYLRWIEDKQS